jgi:hypothetical protein
MAISDQELLGYNPEAKDIDRKRKLAELLMARGMQQPQGQMISGRYVAPSFTQNLSSLFDAYQGNKIGEEQDQRQLALAEKIREAKDLKEKNITNLIAGTPDQSTEMAGPYGQNVNKGGVNVPMPVAVQPGTKPDLAAALREIGTNNPYGAGKEYKATLLGNMIPKAVQPTNEMQNYEFAKTPAGGSFKGSYNDFVNQLTPYQKASLANQANNQAQSRVPMGYRMKQDGSLEPIPGGPADQKAQTVNAGRETVDTLIAGLKDQYSILKQGGGITSTESGMGNIPAYLSSTGVGQTAGKMFGTQNQSARNTIVQSRPLLLAAIKNATGMSAKQMDSNVELKMYLAAATDPSLDYEANMAALNQLETLYGISGNAGNPSSGWRIK